ncbi:hypothetical protein T492DRAFT_874271 [Pavlovales sp. CCMP2436]|nr:hypothetical protein T492DRAFT_874271 [Pavlovales sp. CCMP2436]
MTEGRAGRAQLPHALFQPQPAIPCPASATTRSSTTRSGQTNRRLKRRHAHSSSDGRLDLRLDDGQLDGKLDQCRHAQLDAGLDGGKAKQLDGAQAAARGNLTKRLERRHAHHAARGSLTKRLKRRHAHHDAQLDVQLDDGQLYGQLDSQLDGQLDRLVGGGARLSTNRPSELSTSAKVFVGAAIGNVLSPHVGPLIDRAVNAVAAGLLSIDFIGISHDDAQRLSIGSLRAVALYALLEIGRTRDRHAPGHALGDLHGGSAVTQTRLGSLLPSDLDVEAPIAGSAGSAAGLAAGCAVAGSAAG